MEDNRWYADWTAIMGGNRWSAILQRDSEETPKFVEDFEV